MFISRDANAVNSSFINHTTGSPPTPDPRLEARCARVTATERSLLLDQWNRTEHFWDSEPCLHEFVEIQAQRQPTSVAIICGDQQVTYAELNERARRVACQLVQLGVKPNEVVGVVADRSIDAVLAALGILKAGAAYLPLDHTFPPDRIEFYLQDANVRFVVGNIDQPCLLGHTQITKIPTVGLPESPSVNLPQVSADSLAYVLFTSGSTGKPKGVMLDHRGPANTVRDINNRFDICSQDRVLALSALGFDLSVYDLFGIFAAGGTIVQPTATQAREPASWLNLIEQHQVTIWNSVPALMEMLVTFLDQPEPIPSLQLVMLSGDWIPITLPARIRQIAPQAKLVSLGGSTEASIWSVIHPIDEVPPEWRSIPYGKPLLNQRCYVVDSELNLCPIGEVGELGIAGVGVAMGYLNRPDLTAEHFVNDPFSPTDNLYRTGDLCRYLPDGSIELVGRKDHQVKIRGYRIELGEIENKLLQDTRIREAIVIASREESGARLLAYVVFQAGADASLIELNAELSKSLPSYMLPAALIPLNKFPLTANGKVDRGSLPLPEITRDHATLLQPASKTESIVANILCQLLNLKAIDTRDDFYALGGNSLLAVALVSRIHRECGVRLAYSEILAKAVNTIELAQWIDSTTTEVKEDNLASGISKERLSEAPLSYHQQQLWVVNFLDQNRARYNVPMAYRISGELDCGALRQAISELVNRNDILRTVYQESDEGLKQIVLAPVDFDLPVIDLSQFAGEALEQAFSEQAVAVASELFSLGESYPLRAAVYRCAADEFRLVLVIHHIAIDGHSLTLLHQQLAAYYEACRNQVACQLPPPEHQYANYAIWQQENYPPTSFAKERRYWQEKLAGDLSCLTLPNDHAVTFDTTGKTLAVEINPELLDDLRRFSTANQATLFITLLAAIKATFYRYTQQTDLIVGSAVSTRDDLDTENQLGYFINVLPMRTQIDASGSFLELLGDVRETVLGALAHKNYPFELLKKEILATQATGQDPFRIMFVLEPAPCPLQLAGLPANPLSLDNGTAKFDLLIAAKETSQGLRLELEYRCGQFNQKRIERFAEHLQNLLADAVANPQRLVHQLDLLTDNEQPLVLAGDNARIDDAHAVVAIREKSTSSFVHERFAAQAKECRHAVAARFGDQTLTYEQLDQRANQLANRLVQLEIGPDVPVAISLLRSPEMLISVLGVLKAGGTYVPLDPNLPSLRQQQILADCRPQVLLTDSRLLDSAETQLPVNHILCLDQIAEADDHSTRCPQPALGPDNLAYILYTSGSTGTPKGVAMRHGAVDNLIAWQLNNSTAKAETKTLQFAALSFDVSFQEIFATLCSGGTLYLIEETLYRDLHQLWKFIVATGIERVFLPFVALRSLCESGQDNAREASLREVITAGERLEITPLVRQFFEQLPGCRLWNHYGPTETHVATAYQLEADVSRWPARPPIGMPIDHCAAIVLDQHQQLVPQGVAGELYLGGECLAHGYYHNDTFTQERFIANPLPELPLPRLYRTGDIACWNWQGQLEYLSRNDTQIKLRGHRVELTEIEVLLSHYPAVRQAVVNVKPNQQGGLLIAHVIADRASASCDELKHYLAMRLPSYSVPQQIHIVDEFPKTATGKVDRQRLATWEPTDDTSEQQSQGAERHGTGDAVQAASNASHSVRTPDRLEARLLTIWQTVLGNKSLTIESNFFAAGGDSLSAAMLFSRMEKAFGKAVSITTLVACPTVASLAELYRKQDSARAACWDSIVELSPRGTAAPLICCPGIDGHLLNFRELAKLIGQDRPVIGVQPVGLDGLREPLESIEEIAEFYLRAVRQAVPRGPYHLAGFSFGGVIAYELAQRLRREGEHVTLAMIDATAGLPIPAPWLQRVAFHFRYAAACKGRQRWSYLKERVEAFWFGMLYRFNRISMEQRLERIIDLSGNYAKVAAANMEALAAYQPQPALGPGTLYRAKQRANWPGKERDDPLVGWREAFSAAKIEMVEVDGAHANMLSAEQVSGLAEHLRQAMRGTEEAATKNHAKN
ncbi:amino acid adenylation domain-containing protein [Planctomycetaceae bacterium SH139]